MKLFLMRHADAEPIDRERYPDDDLRPLTRLGCEIQAKMAKALQRMDLKPECIITSPRLRALQTAGITAKVLGLEQAVTQSDALGRDYSVAAALDYLWVLKQERVLCVGHDPDLRELAGALLDMATGSGIKFPKSAVVGIDFRDGPVRGAGILSFFYRPQDVLALLGKSGL